MSELAEENKRLLGENKRLLEENNRLLKEKAEEEVRLEQNKKLADFHHHELHANPNVDLDLLDKIYTPDCLYHNPSRNMRTFPRGPEGAKQLALLAAERRAGGTSRYDHFDHLAEGNLVAFRWVSSGWTKTGEMKPQGYGVDIVRFVKGKIADVWVYAFHPPAEEAERRVGEGWVY